MNRDERAKAREDAIAAVMEDLGMTREQAEAAYERMGSPEGIRSAEEWEPSGSQWTPLPDRPRPGNVRS